MTDAVGGLTIFDLITRRRRRGTTLMATRTSLRPSPPTVTRSRRLRRRTSASRSPRRTSRRPATPSMSWPSTATTPTDRRRPIQELGRSSSTLPRTRTRVISSPAFPPSTGSNAHRRQHHRLAGGPAEPTVPTSQSSPNSGVELRLTPDMVSPGWVTFSPDGAQLYASGAGPTAMFDLATGGLVRELGGHGRARAQPRMGSCSLF